MSVVVNALLPVLLVIATGHLVARMGIITGEQWRGIERIAYFEMDGPPQWVPNNRLLGLKRLPLRITFKG